MRSRNRPFQSCCCGDMNETIPHPNSCNTNADHTTPTSQLQPPSPKQAHSHRTAPLLVVDGRGGQAQQPLRRQHVGLARRLGGPPRRLGRRRRAAAAAAGLLAAGRRCCCWGHADGGSRSGSARCRRRRRRRLGPTLATALVVDLGEVPLRHGLLGCCWVWQV
jgi:hypothetical protein